MVEKVNPESKILRFFVKVKTPRKKMPDFNLKGGGGNFNIPVSLVRWIAGKRLSVPGLGGNLNRIPNP